MGTQRSSSSSSRCYLHNENRFRWNLDGSDTYNWKDRCDMLPQHGSYVHFYCKNPLKWKRSSYIRNNFTICLNIDFLQLYQTGIRQDFFISNLHLHILQHSPSSWIWSLNGQFSLGQSCTGSCRVQLIRPLSQAHSTQRLGRWEEPCEIGILLIWQPTKIKEG